MEPIILMNSKWGNDIFTPMYLFFGGLTGGLFIVAVVADLVGIKHKSFEKLSKLVAFIVPLALVLAGLFITFHLGKPERGMFFPLYFSNFNSWMVIGGYSVGLAFPMIIAYALLWYYKVNQTIRRLLGVVGIPLLGFVSLYTGLLLSGAKFVPLWSQQYLPYLFLNSGILTGLAAAGLAFLLFHTFVKTELDDMSRILQIVGYAILALIVVEGLELYLFMNHLALNPEKLDETGKFINPNGGALAYEYVTQGVLAPWFWWGIVGMGLTFPLILTFIEMIFDKIIRPYVNWVAGVKFASILAGGIILRFVIVWGGDLKAPLVFPPALFQLPLSG